MNNTEQKVLNFIKKKNLIPENVDTIYVGTSGGADSMALLAFLHKNTNKNIVAVHVNHGIRDKLADRDENFVYQYCTKNNIEFIAFNAKKDGVDIPFKPSEEWARNLRYSYFNTLPKHNAIIATAHTASDQTETLLFRIARGCGLNGLCGIPAKRDNIIRPFLILNRMEVEFLVDLYKTNNITDESNLTDAYARNKIRHHVVPVLKDINPKVEHNVTKTCDRIQKAYDFINATAIEQEKQCKLSNGCWYDVIKLKKCHIAVLEQMLLNIFANYDISEGLLDKITYSIYNNDSERPEYKVLEIPIDSNNTIVVTNKVLSLKTTNSAIEVNVGNNAFGNWGHGLIVTEETFEMFNKASENKRNLAFYVDGDKYDIFSWNITSKQNGDKFKPACRYETKAVNHLNGYMDEKNNMPIVRDQNGNIVYLHGVGFSDNMLPNKNTKTIYRFQSY